VGRRSVSVADQDAWVFNRIAQDYRARPGYPVELVERLAELAGGPGRRVADLGAGAGHLALPLAARGLRVAAVEPARAMLAALEELCERLEAERRAPVHAAPAATLSAVHAAAEATGLPAASFDLVLLADAVHWVDPALAGAEIARLLAPGGRLALVEAAFARTPFMDGLAGLLARANPKARPGPDGPARQLLSLAAPGRPPAVERFRQSAPLDAAGLAALLGSFTYAGPALGAGALRELVARAEGLARAAGGARFERDLTLRWVGRS
jgi:SAM-dependent methyltransferase